MFKRFCLFILVMVSPSVFSQAVPTLQFLDRLLDQEIIPSTKHQELAELYDYDTSSHAYFVKTFGWYNTENKALTQANGMVTVIKNDDSIRTLNLKAYCTTILDHKERRNSTVTYGAYYYTRLDPLIVALWARENLYDSLALQFYEQALDSPYTRTQARAVKHINNQLAWSVYIQLIDLLQYGELQQCIQLVSIYEKYHLDAVRYQQGRALCTDIRRRIKEEQHLKVPIDSLPIDFTQWDTATKISFLIQSLDQVNESSTMMLTHFDFDWRVTELIKLGNAAIPELINTLDNDQRLTRSTHCQRSFNFNRSILSVSEVALRVIEKIFRHSFYSAPSTSSSYTTTGLKTKAQISIDIHNYWKKHQNTPYEEVLFSHLNNPNLSINAKRKAFKTLVFFPRLTENGGYRYYFGPKNIPPINPLIQKFHSPSIGELGIPLLMEELQYADSSNINHDSLRIHQQYGHYYRILADSSVCSDLVKVYDQEKRWLIKANWAYTLDVLGQSTTLLRLFRSLRHHDFTTTDKKLVSTLIQYFSERPYAQSHHFIEKLIRQNDSFTQVWQHGIASMSFQWSYDWVSHPQGVVYLTQLLEDTSSIGSGWIEDHYYYFHHEFTSRSSSGSSSLTNQDVTTYHVHDTIVLLKKHLAAESLSSITMGVPKYHPLLKKSDSILTLYQAYYNHFHKMEINTSSSLIKVSGQDSFFERLQLVVPNISLSKAATLHDLIKGKALFHIPHQKMKKVDYPLQVATFSLPNTPAIPIEGYILQAEQNEAGHYYVGVVTNTCFYFLKKNVYEDKWQLIDTVNEVLIPQVLNINEY